MKIFKLAKKTFLGEKQAFTLVEILIVLAIITVMTGVALSSAGKNKGVNELGIAADQVIASLRSIQNDAVNGKIINDGSNDVMICKTALNVVAGSKSYELKYYACGTGGALIETRTLYFSAKKDGGSIIAESDATFAFSVPQGVVVTTIGSLQLELDLSNSIYVCIGNSGDIYAKKTTCPVTP